jgi:hypothetical protein
VTAAPTPNRAPVVVHVIPAQSIPLGGAKTLDLSDYFTDPEGDTITYTAEIVTGGQTSAVVSGSTLSIRAFSFSSSTVRVTATDEGGSGRSVSQTFEIVPGA